MSARHHARQGRGLRGHHAARRPPGHPWILHYVAHTGSRELFRLAVLAIALGVAFGAAELFGVSFALGAFFAGMMLSESELEPPGRRRDPAAARRLRGAVLRLGRHAVRPDDPGHAISARSLATFLIIVVGKSLAAFAIVRLFGHPNSTALTIAASLAQIGEFSFILAGLGVSLQILPERGRDLILAGAILSILMNPFLFTLLDRWFAKGDAIRARRKPTLWPRRRKPSRQRKLRQPPRAGHSPPHL